ncbi:hypothetical protein [Aeromonas phage AerS_266]|nr:hypothetical protein [Aeromonas phage AerS_266]
MFKYLFGETVLEGIGEQRFSRGRCLAITRRDDAFQHKEMAVAVRMIPFNGGFCNALIRDKTKYLPEHFNGESISCNVKTKEDTEERIKALLSSCDIYVAGAGTNKCFTVMLFVPKDRNPGGSRREGDVVLDWKKIEREEYQEIWKRVFDDDFYGC